MMESSPGGVSSSTIRREMRVFPVPQGNARHLHCYSPFWRVEVLVRRAVLSRFPAP